MDIKEKLASMTDEERTIFRKCYETFKDLMAQKEKMETPIITNVEYNGSLVSFTAEYTDEQREWHRKHPRSKGFQIPFK